MNITDIDDKIIKKSQETGVSWKELSKTHESEFWNDLRNLNVIEPSIKIRVTENIPKIIAFIENIISKGLAYVGQDGSVYFNVKSFPNYGKLQKLNLEEENAYRDSNINKNEAVDFALWKARKTDMEPSWESPWGLGRPGWHIECSALASFIFGSRIDFHAGGLDLKFPHHENEEAQSCAFHDTQQWVNYWLHTGQLSVKGQSEKMSKSLKNTISIDDMLKKYSADDFRMACTLSNYRNNMEYSEEVMDTAKNTLNKLIAFQGDCRAYLEGRKKTVQLDSSEILAKLSHSERDIDTCLKDDFNTAKSIGVMLEIVSEVNRAINMETNDTLVSSSGIEAVAAVENHVNNCLSSYYGFKYFMPDEVSEKSTSNSVDIKLVLDDILLIRKDIRERAIKTKNKELFNVCDDMRNCLKRNGIEIKDHNQGSSWSFK